MYSVIVTMTVRPEERETFERAMKELVASVKADEPGAVCYHVLRNRDQPARYRVLEIYASKDSFKAHLSSPHVQKANPQVQKTLATPPEVEVLEIV
jgi:autoinducer 2-degrading protein